MNEALFPVVSLLALAATSFAHSIYNTNKQAFLRSVRSAVADFSNDDALMAAYMCSRQLQFWPRLALIFSLWAMELLILVFRQSGLFVNGAPSTLKMFAIFDFLSPATFVAMVIITLRLYFHPANTRFNFS
jgi:hypothetical protein